MTLMKVKSLVKSYPGVKALNGTDMEIESGRIVGLLGPNTSGKTTLLKILAGLLRQDSGEIVYPNNSQGVEARNTVSFLPDSMLFPAWMSVKDAFGYYKDCFGDYCEKNATRLSDILELPLNDKKSIRKLSKGMQERVALALTFSRKVPLYLLDEPLGGIDPVGKSKILETLLTAPPENSSILISTHLVKDVENILDSVLMLSKGQIVYSGNCEEIRETKGKTVEQIYLEVFQ